MRILHTSDWHVGRTMRGRDRSDEHKAVLAEIIQIAQQREPDLVLVAGDLFDVAAPSPASERIVYEALLGLAGTGAAVVILSGNHDNPHRLQAIKPILETGCGVHVAANLRRPEDGGILDLKVRTGETASIALLPFLSQRGIVKAADLMEKDAFEHAQSYAARIQAIAALLADALDPKAVRILLAHLAVTGAQVGGGERAAHTGLDYMVSSIIFSSSLHYAALGHFHRCQSIPAGCQAWYSGSPLQLDFGEEEQKKAVLWIEARPDAPATVEEVRLQSGRRLRTVRGTMATLEAMAAEVSEDFLRIEVDESYRPGLADEVRDLLPHAVDVRIKASAAKETSQKNALEIHERSSEDLFAEFLKDRQKDSEDLTALFKDLFEEQLGVDEDAPEEVRATEDGRR